MSGASASGSEGGGLEGLMLALRPGDEAMALELLGLIPSASRAAKKRGRESDHLLSRSVPQEVI